MAFNFGKKKGKAPTAKPPAPAAQPAPEPKTREGIFQKGLEEYKAGRHDIALQLFLKAANQGYGKAQFQCAIMYENGEGTEQDLGQASDWMSKAAAQGEKGASSELLRIRDKHFWQLMDPTSTAKKASTSPEPAKMSALTSELPKPIASAAANRAQTQGRESAGKNADCSKDAGVDKAKLLMQYEKAAGKGSAKAQYSCGLMYDNGDGTVADKAKALMWYEKAAEQGNADAQFNCGVMYYNGEGTARDKAKAKMWLEKAAAQTENKTAQERAQRALGELF